MRVRYASRSFEYRSERDERRLGLLCAAPFQERTTEQTEEMRLLMPAGFYRRVALLALGGTSWCPLLPDKSSHSGGDNTAGESPVPSCPSSAAYSSAHESATSPRPVSLCSGVSVGRQAMGIIG